MHSGFQLHFMDFKAPVEVFITLPPWSVFRSGAKRRVYENEKKYCSDSFRHQQIISVCYMIKVFKRFIHVLYCICKYLNVTVCYECCMRLLNGFFSSYYSKLTNAVLACNLHPFCIQVLCLYHFFCSPNWQYLTYFTIRSGIKYQKP